MSQVSQFDRLGILPIKSPEYRPHPFLRTVPEEPLRVAERHERWGILGVRHERTKRVGSLILGLRSESWDFFDWSSTPVLDGSIHARPYNAVPVRRKEHSSNSLIHC